MGNEESSRPRSNVSPRHDASARSNVSPRSNVFENDPDETKLLEEQRYLTDGRTSQGGDDDDIPVPPPYIPDASLSPESEAEIPIFDDDHSTPITGLPVPSDHNTPVQEALSQESAVANSNSTPVYSNLSTPPGQKNQTPFAVYIDDDDQITPDTTDKTPVYLSDTQNETHKTSEVNTESNVTRSNSIISSKTGYSEIQSHGLSPVEYQSLRNCLLNLPLEGQEMQEKAIERVDSHILIQDYEARTDILMKGTMATSDVKVVCGVCEAQHITKPADHWCSECEEGLCDDCLKFHKASKSSRHHGVISVHDYKQLPSSVTSIVQYCQEHDTKYQNYCPQHESLCCPICIANDHKDCVRIQALEEILKTAKTSTLLDSMVQSLTGIKTNLNNIIADRKQNLGKIKEQREEINSDIELTRKKLNKQLDVLQQNLLTDLTTNAQTVTSEIEMLVKKLEERVRHVDDLQHRILAVKQYASDLQAFLGSKSVETEVEKEEKYIHSLMTDGSLQQVELICKLDETLLSRLSNAKSFGTMTLDKRHSSVSINTEKEKQAQILTSAVTKTEKLCLEQIMKSNVPIGVGESTSITGCTISPSGKFILADGVRNKRLLILNENGTLDKEISLSPNKPYDVACLDETLVAVTCWCDRKILIVNTVTKITERTINTTNPCEGIAGIQGTLVCCERSQGIRSIKVDDGSSSYLFKENIPQQTYVAISGDHVYHTNHINHTVTCYKLSGEKVWEFNDESLLKRPFGVTVDNSSNVYVASPKYNSVGVMSSDGKFCRQLLTETDGIDKAYAIHFDRKTNKLLVTNSGGTVLLYKVS